jgi:hypothetical protein
MENWGLVKIPVLVINEAMLHKGKTPANLADTFNFPRVGLMTLSGCDLFIHFSAHVSPIVTSTSTGTFPR